MDSNQFTFIRDAYLHQREQRTVFDNKASFLVGVSGVIFAISASKAQQMGFLFIAFFSLLTMVLSIWTISSPFHRAGKGVFSFLCWSGFQGMKDEEYEKNMMGLISSDEKMVHEYLKEIEAISRYSIEPKAKLVRFAGIILSFSLIFGLGLIIFGI